MILLILLVRYVKAARALKDHGARRVFAYCVHPVLSGNACQTIDDSCLNELVVCDTIPLCEKAQKSKKIRQISLTSIVAETIYE